MINQVDLSNWIKQKDILSYLQRECGIYINSREWRNEVEKNNKDFTTGKARFYITHSNSLGYKATTDYKEAKIGRNDYIKRALNMLKKARDCDKAFQTKNNYQIDFEKGEIK